MSDTDEMDEQLDDEASEDEEPEACSCPELDPDEWDGVESDWSDIVFLRTNVRAAAGVPIGYPSRRIELRERAEAMGATIPDDPLFLLGPGNFRRPLLLEVEDVPEDATDVYRPGGVAYSRLHEAPYGEMKQLMADFTKEAEQEYGRKPEGIYLWYLTCRACSAERNFETLFVAHFP